jgi:hypothetical protein
MLVNVVCVSFLINIYIITINKYVEKERQTCRGPVHTCIIIPVFNLETFISILFYFAKHIICCKDGSMS